MKLKKGDIVRLSSNAIKDFYGTDYNVDMFQTPGKDFTKKDFVEYVSVILGFENGENYGIVMESANEQGCVLVGFNSIQGWQKHLYDEKGLVLEKRI